MKTALVCKKHVYNVRFKVDKKTQLYYCPKCRANKKAQAQCCLEGSLRDFGCYGKARHGYLKTFQPCAGSSNGRLQRRQNYTPVLG